MTGTADRPLAGVKVIDIGHYVAAPLAAMMLADQGADVIRVKRPGHRAVTPLAEALDRGKSVISLDLKTPADNAKATPAAFLAGSECGPGIVATGAGMRG
jgi:crotonobetainyl-CoA:carnitine CoA-transferase CaiB-like acyl-CoA transferase